MGQSFSFKSLTITLSKFLLTALVIYFVGIQLVTNWDDVIAYPWVPNILLLVISILVYLLTFALFSKTWCWLMRGFDHVVTLKQGFKISYIATLGRYIPGRIWPLFGMIHIAKKAKINEETAIASWGLSMLLSIPPAFVVGFVCMVVSPSMSERMGGVVGIGLYSVALVSLFVSLLPMIFPNLFLSWANWGLKKIKRSPITLKMTMKLTGLVYVGYIISWALYGFAFWIFLYGLTPSPGVPLIYGIGSYVLSYQIGYLAIFTPGGLGARELVMIALLSPYMGASATGVAVVARVWSTIGDIIASVIALSLKIDDPGK